jgi:hypothetical protein
LDGDNFHPAVRFDAGCKTYQAGSFSWVSGNLPCTNESLHGLVQAGESYQFLTSIYGTDDISGVPTTAPEALRFYATGSSIGDRPTA